MSIPVCTSSKASKPAGVILGPTSPRKKPDCGEEGTVQSAGLLTNHPMSVEKQRKAVGRPSGEKPPIPAFDCHQDLRMKSVQEVSAAHRFSSILCSHCETGEEALPETTKKCLVGRCHSYSCRAGQGGPDIQ